MYIGVQVITLLKPTEMNIPESIKNNFESQRLSPDLYTKSMHRTATKGVTAQDH